MNKHDDIFKNHNEQINFILFEILKEIYFSTQTH